jgi:hypothetical protein
MECASCGSSIPASFGHAIRKNECPACGQAIMDEEALALLDDLRSCVSSAVRLRDEAVERVALAVIASYDIAPKGPRRQAAPRPPAPPVRQQQQPPRTQAQQARYEDEGSMVGEEELEEGIIQTADLVDPNNPLSEEERERIMEERVAARYQMIPQSQATTTPEAARARVRQAVGAPAMSDSELMDNPVLEQQRIARLQRQEANIAAGMASVRRSDE